MTETIAVWVSCGLASAVAAKMTVDRYGTTHRVLLCNNPVAAEGEDNRRLVVCQSDTGGNLSRWRAFFRGTWRTPVGLLESLVIFIIVIAACYYLLTIFPLPAPFGRIVQIMLGAIVAIIIVKLLFSLLGGGGFLSFR